MMEHQTKFFYELAPQHILEAVETIGVRCTGRILQLNSMENRVYEVEIETDCSGAASRYAAFRVIKFYRPGRWSKEQIIEEHQFLQALVAQDVPVVAPLMFPGGKNETLREFNNSGIFYAVFPKIGGRLLDELTFEQLEKIGRTIARLHIVGAARPARHRLELSAENYGRNSAEFLLQSALLPEEIKPQYRQLTESICGIAEQRLSGVSRQRIHGDLHCGNILWDREQCLLVDFDDMVTGPTVQDLWLLLPGRDEEDRLRRERLLYGYEQLRRFDRNELDLVEALRSLRIIRFSAWIAARWQDPAFPLTFPLFGSNQYWRDHLMTLQEQLQLLQGVVW